MKLTDGIQLALVLILVTVCRVPAIAGDSPPELLIATLQAISVPIYPIDAIASHRSGDVTVKFTVSPDGSVATADGASTDSSLVAPCTDAIRQWRFAKGPLASKLPKQGSIVIRFVLEKSSVVLDGSGKQLALVVPSERVDGGRLLFRGPGFGLLAATRAHPTGAHVAQNMVVQVETETTQTGAIHTAKALTGSPGFREAAEEAARNWTFRVLTVDGNPVRLLGILVFNWRAG